MSGPIMPVPNLGKGCPSGYNQNSNGMCVPTSSATPLVQAVGTSCPSGYNYNSSGYCVGTKKNSPAAYLHGGGQCATGYTRSNHHCRENVVKKKIICDYFYQNGLLSKKLWELDEAYGDILSQREPLTMIGYHLWAVPYVSEMEKKSIKGKIYLAIAKLLVPHWAKYLAGERTFRGKILHVIGKPICNLLGRLSIKMKWQEPQEDFLLQRQFLNAIVLEKE